jgi:membrane protein YqaA with SNARE-associated domain
MKWIRELYDWVLKWAHTPYGSLALFLIAVAESSVFPIPPDVLLIALCLGHRESWLKFATICTAGSVLGAAIGYGIGWGLWHAVDQFFFTYVPGFTEHQFQRVQELYREYDVAIVFAAAFTPIPYKVITVTAGVFGLNFLLFILVSIVGRAARFFLVAGLLYWFGEPIGQFIDKRFNMLVTMFTVLLIGGFYVLKYVF